MRCYNGNFVKNMAKRCIFMYNYSVLLYIFEYRVKLIKILYFSPTWTVCVYLKEYNKDR